MRTFLVTVQAERLPFLIAALCLTACSADDPLAPVPLTCQTGGLWGELCLPGTGQPLAGATVSLTAVDCNGKTQTYEAQTNDRGKFALPGLPVGEQTLVVTSAQIDTTLVATAEPGRNMNVQSPGDGPWCVNPAPRLAVIGIPHVNVIFDSVETVLDSLGMTYDLMDHRNWFNPNGGPYSVAYEFLMDLPRMLTYDAIFINCGVENTDFMVSTIEYPSSGTPTYDNSTLTFDFSDPIYQNVRSYVQQGGNLYVSDWRAPFVEAVDANLLDFYGNDTNGYDARVGQPATFAAQIVDPGMRSFVNSATVTVSYPDPSALYWVVAEQAASNVIVYVRGDPPIKSCGNCSQQIIAGKPLLVSATPFTGGGQVIFTTFHYHAQPPEEMLDVLRYLVFQL